MTESKRQRVTGLYVNTTDKGVQYMSGKTQDGKRYSIWPNGYKEEGDNQPPFVLFVQDIEPQMTIRFNCSHYSFETATARRP